MGLLTLQFSSHLNALRGNSSLYTLDNDKRLEWNAGKQPQLTASALSPVFSSRSRKYVQPLHKEQPAV